MYSTHAIIIAAVLATAACSNASAANDQPAAPSRAAATSAPSSARTSGHDAVRDDIKWGPAPSVFPAGAEFAVMQGDPSKAEPFTIRLRFPNGYRIPPHIHPTLENVTVIAGTFLAGMGERFVESEMKVFGRGDFASIPANHPHYAMARGQTVVQVHSVGPFAMTYVDPADAPAAR